MNESESDAVSGFPESDPSYEELSTGSLILDGILPPRQSTPPVPTAENPVILLGSLRLDSERAMEVISLLPALRHGPPNLVCTFCGVFVWILTSGTSRSMVY